MITQQFDVAKGTAKDLSTFAFYFLQEVPRVRRTMVDNCKSRSTLHACIELVPRI